MARLDGAKPAMVLMAVTNFLFSLLLGLDKVRKFHTNLFRFSDDNGEVVTAKPKGVAQGNIYFSLLGFIKSKVEFWIKLRVVSKVIDRGRNNSFVDREQTSNGFNRTRCAQQMARHAFGRTDIQFISMLTE